jgi:toxin ParE1/3/4
MKLPASLSSRAEADLSLQYRWYSINAGENVAERFLLAFKITARQLEQHPRLGRVRRFRTPELSSVRSFPISGPFGSHLIFYRLESDCIRIERVMHGARDLERQLVEPPD